MARSEAYAAKPVVRLIQQDELDVQIAARAQHKNQFGNKPSKPLARKNERAKETVPTSASDLKVPDGVFRQQDGTTLGPLRPGSSWHQCQRGSVG